MMESELMTLLDRATVIRYHQLLMQQYGTGTPEALGWLQPQGQQARFGILSQIADLNGCSISDVGCGHADLFPFLKNRYPHFHYYGLEQMPELLSVAVERYRQEEACTFLLADFMQSSLPVADFVLASGSFSYRSHQPGFIFSAIERLFRHCRAGLGFNLLSGGTPPGSLLVAYPTDLIFSFCKTLSPHVVLKQGYWQNDFTIFIYH